MVDASAWDDPVCSFALEEKWAGDPLIRIDGVEASSDRSQALQRRRRQGGSYIPARILPKLAHTRCTKLSVRVGVEVIVNRLNSREDTVAYPT